MFKLPNVDQKIFGIYKEKLEIQDDFTMSHFLKDINIRQGKWLNVQKLTMKNSKVTDKAIQELSDNKISQQIESLDLQNNYSSITDNTLNIISKSKYMLNLRHLDLSDNSITDEGLQFLFASPSSQNLVELILYGNVQVSSNSLKYLASSNYCKLIQKLDLRSTYVNDEGIKEFMQSKNSQNLTYLNIAMNFEAITDESLIALSLSRHMHKIEYLNVANCCISDKGIYSICSSMNFCQLKELDISNDDKNQNLADITDSSLEYLSDSTCISNLERLNLKGLNITSNGINMISVSYNFQYLQVLRLSQNQGINDQAIDSLVSGYDKNLKQLQKIYLNDTQITEKGIQYIMTMIPNIDVLYDFVKRIKAENRGGQIQDNEAAFRRESYLYSTNEKLINELNIQKQNQY